MGNVLGDVDRMILCIAEMQDRDYVLRPTDHHVGFDVVRNGEVQPFGTIVYWWDPMDDPPGTGGTDGFDAVDITGDEWGFRHIDEALMFILQGIAKHEGRAIRLVVKDGVRIDRPMRPEDV